MSFNTLLLESILSNHFNFLFTKNHIVSVKHEQISISWLSCALTEIGPAILIEVDSSDSPFSSSKNNLRKNFSRYIEMNQIIKTIDEKEKKFIAISCKRRELKGLFERLMADLIWNLIDNGPKHGDPWNFIDDRLAGWKLLFSNFDRKLEEKGLLGELYVLKHLMLKYNLPVTIWDGPLGGTKDFRLINQNIEVKSTSIRNGYYVEINGLYQTTLMQSIERMIFVRLEETSNGNISINSLIKDIENYILKNKGQVDDFYNRLNRFSTDILDSSNKWEVLESVVMNIDHNFPRISTESFINGKVPNNVIQITWIADLASLKKSNLTETEFIS